MDTDLMVKQAKDAMMKAKVHLQFKCPFYAVPVMHATLSPSEYIPTAGVDRYANITYNPKWIIDMEPKYLPGLLCHEILHIMLLHLTRNVKGAFLHRVWNIAEDIKINYIIQLGTSFELPPGGYIPRGTKCEIPPIGYTIQQIDQKSTEQIFEEILPKFKKKAEEEAEAQGQQGGESEEMGDTGRGGMESGMTTDIHDRSTKTQDGDKTQDEKDADEKAEAGKIGDKWKQITASAVTIARQQGNMPAGMEHLVEELFEPKIDWREKLMRFLSDKLPFDFTWTTRNKKSRALGIYLPSMLGEQLEVLVHMDSSGSVFQSAPEFLTEIQGILGSFSNVKMTLIVIDMEIKGVFDLNTSDIDDIMGSIEVKGGGGTSHAPLIKWVDENLPDAKVVISLTDGYSDWEEYGPQLAMPVFTALGGGYCKIPNTFDTFSEVIVLDPN